MKIYEVISALAYINAGLVMIDAEQADARSYALIKVSEDSEEGTAIYEVNRPIQFKRGEIFGSDQEFAKSIDVREVGADDTQPRKPARRGRKPKEPAAPASSGAPPAGADGAPPASDPGATGEGADQSQDGQQ